jgi:hypothetical protein
MRNINHDKKDDSFQKILKEKLDNYSFPVDNDVWQRIEESLNKRPRKIILWPWISAAAVLGALLLFPVNDKKTGNCETTSQLSKHEEEEAINGNVPVETINPPVSTASLKPESVFMTLTTQGEYAEAGSRPETEINAIEEEIVPDISAPQKQNEQPEKSVVWEKPPVYREVNPFEDSSFPVKKAKKRKSISLSLGSGGSLTAMNTNTGTNPMFDGIIGDLRSDFYTANSESKTEERLLIEDFPKVTH